MELILGGIGLSAFFIYSLLRFNNLGSEQTPDNKLGLQNYYLTKRDNFTLKRSRNRLNLFSVPTKIMQLAKNRMNNLGRYK